MAVTPAVSRDDSEEEAQHYRASHQRMFDEPGFLIRRLHQISVSIFLECAKDLDMTQVQLASLTITGAYPGIDQTSLAKAAALDRQTTSNVVTRLLKKGLIRRTPGERRTKKLYLTGAGRAMIEAVRTRVAPVPNVLLESLNASERKQFVELLKKVVNANNNRSRAPFSIADGTRPRRPFKS